MQFELNLYSEVMSKGRPSKKTDELVKRILSLANQNLSISKISKMDDMPNRITIYRWMKADENFKKLFYEASEMHHLKKAKNRPFSMRVMVDVGAKMVGKRITTSLKTYCPEEAKVRRDIAIAQLQNLGIKLIGSFPKSKKKPI